MLQGFSTGGEYGTAATYMSEIAVPGRRGFWASFQYVTLIGGQLCATLVILVVAAAALGGGDAELRLAYPVPDRCRGGGRRAGAAARAARDDARRGPHAEAGSVLVLLRRNGRAFATVVVLTAGGSLAFYTFTTYMQKYLVLTVGLSPGRPRPR